METAPRRIGLAALYALCLAPPPGKVAAILGPGACRLALRALARPLLSGEPVVAVDGGNRFDPYEVARAERALGGSGRETLSRLLVSRAFTCHQMEALLVRRLPAALSRSRARVALVLALPETFADGDVPYPEACRVFRSCLSALRRISREGTRVVVTGEGASLSMPDDAAGGSSQRHLERGRDCVERKCSERAQVASVAEREPPAPLRAPRWRGTPDGKCQGGTRNSGCRGGFFRYLARTSDPLLMLTGWRMAGDTLGLNRDKVVERVGFP